MTSESSIIPGPGWRTIRLDDSVKCRRRSDAIACCVSRFPAPSPILQRRSGLAQRGYPHVATACPAACLPGAPGAGADPDPSGGELRHPWGLAFLPDGGYLVSERPGRLLRIDAGGERHVISGLPPAAAGRGLLDLALDGEGWVYLSYSEPGTAAPAPPWPGPAAKRPGRLATAVSPAAQVSPVALAFGSRLVLTDDYLFITLGTVTASGRGPRPGQPPRQDGAPAQDGRVPADNPFVKTAGPCRRSGAWAIATCRGRRCARQPAILGHEHGPRAGTR